MKQYSTPKTKINLKVLVEIPKLSSTKSSIINGSPKRQANIDFKKQLKFFNTDHISHRQKISQNKTEVMDTSSLLPKPQQHTKEPKVIANRSQSIKEILLFDSPTLKTKKNIFKHVIRVKTPVPQRPTIPSIIPLASRPKTALKQATTTKLIVHKLIQFKLDSHRIGFSRPKSSQQINSSRFGGEQPMRPQTQLSINSDLNHVCLPSAAPRKRRQPSQTLKKENCSSQISKKSLAERSGSSRRGTMNKIYPPTQKPNTPNRLMKIIENPTSSCLSPFQSQPKCQLGPKPQLAKIAQVKTHTKLKSLAMPPLHLACLNQDAKLVEKLVRKERQPVDQIFNSETPLHVACRVRSVEVVEKLLLARASTEISDGNGDTILHLMAKQHSKLDTQDLWDLVVPFCSQILKVKNKHGLTAQQILNRKRCDTPDALKKEGCLRLPTNKNFRAETTFSGQSDDCVSESRSYSPAIQFNLTDRPHTSTKLTQQPNIVKFKSPQTKVTTANFVAHQLLGAGSFGEVFLVERKSDKKLLAMKVLSKKKVKEQGLEKYTYTERNIMSTMKHPFIVPLLYAFQTQERLFLVSDYCSGGDLSQYLQIEGKFSEEIAKLYISEVLVALEALHYKNVLYRDLKPDNVVLDEQGHVLLTDFGLSREGVQRGDLGAGSFCGSYAYLSPEIVKKQGHGKSVDCYMLGVLLHEMLFGLPPFYDDDKDQLFNNILNQSFQIDRSINSISAQAEDLLSRLLERDPQKRIGALSIEEVKYHSFFNGTNWEDVLQRKLNMPSPYLSDLASKIVKDQPYLVAGHPSTVGNPCPRMSPSYYKNWSFHL